MTFTFTHTNHCTTTRAAFETWVAQYPHYCPECGASGEIHTEDSVDYGSTTATLYGTEPCPNCIENGACPRCGEQWLTTVNFQYNAENAVPCPFCGWEWNRNPGDSAPVFECECEMNALDNWLDSRYG